MTRPPSEWWCREPGSNWRHRDFQSRALPTELSRPEDRPSWSPVGRGRIPRGPLGPQREPDAPDRSTAPRTGQRLSAGQSRPVRAAWSAGSRGCSPVSSRSRLIRSTIGGWVEKRPAERFSNFLIGFVKYRCWVAREATSRTSLSEAIVGQRALEPVRVAGQLDRRRVGEVLALAADRELDEPRRDRGDDGQDDRDDEEDDLESASAAAAVAVALAGRRRTRTCSAGRSSTGGRRRRRGRRRAG